MNAQTASPDFGVPSSYQPLQASTSRKLSVRGLQYHLREWGDPADPLVVMLHGWMDVSASFQFLVDALQRRWHVVAPDWRGYGLTDWPATDCYWVPDYLGDLDAILRELSPKEPARIVAHSMGGNVASLYAGVRPDRVLSLVNIEGLGLAGDSAEKAPSRLARWLDELAAPPELKRYSDLQAVASRLKKTNPRLTDARALFLASHWSRQDADGQYSILGDPAHKVINPSLYRTDEVEAIWRRITAPVLWIMARDSDYAKKMDGLPDYASRLASIAQLQREWVEDAGHMMHHDQPERLAELIDGFLP